LAKDVLDSVGLFSVELHLAPFHRMQTQQLSDGLFSYVNGGKTPPFMSPLTLFFNGGLSSDAPDLSFLVANCSSNIGSKPGSTDQKKTFAALTGAMLHLLESSV
jgi:hypothetical protein